MYATDRMILFLHQNNRTLEARKRKLFPELSDSEIEEMEAAYAEVYTRQKNI